MRWNHAAFFVNLHRQHVVGLLQPRFPVLSRIRLCARTCSSVASLVRLRSSAPANCKHRRLAQALWYLVQAREGPLACKPGSSEEPCLPYVLWCPADAHTTAAAAGCRIRQQLHGEAKHWQPVCAHTHAAAQE